MPGKSNWRGTIYSFNLTDSAYANATTSWDLRLYDIQTYTRLTLNATVAPVI